MFNYICDNWTWFLPLWCFLNWMPMWCVIYSHKRWNPELIKDECYAPFLRLDYPEWSYVWTIFTHFFFWPRFAVIHICALAPTFIGPLMLIG